MTITDSERSSFREKGDDDSLEQFLMEVLKKPNVNESRFTRYLRSGVFLNIESDNDEEETVTTIMGSNRDSFFQDEGEDVEDYSAILLEQRFQPALENPSFTNFKKEGSALKQMFQNVLQNPNVRESKYSRYVKNCMFLDSQDDDEDNYYDSDWGSDSSLVAEVETFKTNTSIKCSCEKESNGDVEEDEQESSTTPICNNLDEVFEKILRNPNVTRSRYTHLKLSKEADSGSYPDEEDHETRTYSDPSLPIKMNVGPKAA